MRYIIVWVLFMTSFSSLASNSKTIVVLGDSLSAGYGIDPEKSWVALLQQRLTAAQSPYQVINASISGDTSANGWSRTPPLLKQHHPSIVVLALGANDGLRGFPVKTAQGYLEKIILACHQIQAKVVLVGIHVPPNYGAHYAKVFHQMYHQLAAQYQLPLLPFLLQGVATHAELIQADGLHPNALAQPIIEQHVWSVLGSQLSANP